MSVCKLAFLHLNELLHILDYSRFQNLSMKYRYKNVLWSPQEPCKSLNRFCSGVRCLYSMLFPKVVELECPERVVVISELVMFLLPSTNIVNT